MVVGKVERHYGGGSTRSTSSRRSIEDHQHLDFEDKNEMGSGRM
jgi:hypothetical protein